MSIPTPTVGLLSHFLDGFFNGEVIAAIDAAARVYGLRLVVVETSLPWVQKWSDSEAKADRLVPVAWDHLDGLISLTDALTENLRDLIAVTNKPLVTISAQNPFSSCPAIMLDSYGGALTAVRHLLDHGHRDIAFAAWLGHIDGCQRLDGYRAALLERGIAPNPALVFPVGDNLEGEGRIAGAALLAAGMPCTAVLLGTDLGAIGLMQVVQSAGYRVPEDLAVIGFDDIALSRQCSPPLTSIAHRFDLLGTWAVEELLALLSKRAIPGGPRYLPAELVCRRSCGCTQRAPEPSSNEEGWSLATWPTTLSGRLARSMLETLGQEASLSPDVAWPGVTALVARLGAILDGSGKQIPCSVESVWQAACVRAKSMQVLEQILAILESAANIRLGFLGGGDEAARERVRVFLNDARQAIVRYTTMSGLRVEPGPISTNAQGYQVSFQFSKALLHPDSGSAADLAWAKYSPLRRCLLGLWDEEPQSAQRSLVVRGSFNCGAIGELSLGQRLLPESFPPRWFLDLDAGHGAPPATLIIPLATSDRPWGYLAVLGLTDPRLYQAENPQLRLVPALLTQALEHEALSRQSEAQQKLLLARQMWLMALQRVTARMAIARTPIDVADALSAEDAASLEASIHEVHLLTADGDRLEVLGPPHYDRASRRGPKVLVRNVHSPMWDALRTGEPIWIASISQALPRYPEALAAYAAVGSQAVASVPLRVKGRPIGTMSVSYGISREFDREEREFLLALAGLAAQALDRAGLYEREQERALAAEHLARMRGEFVASVSHELRTPLTSIMGFVELLEARWDVLSDEARKQYVRRVVESANRQRRLVDDLLLVGRLDLNAFSIECKSVDLDWHVRQVVAEIRGSYLGQPFDLAGPYGAQVLADPVRLAQILTNIIENAAKYSPEGTRVEIAWDVRDQLVTLRVRDHGPGIPAESRAILFTRFGRVPGSRVRAGRAGTGLGLFLSRQLAQAMGGDLNLEESGADGSTFRLQLPEVLRQKGTDIQPA